MREMSSMSIEKFRRVVNKLDGRPTDEIVALLDQLKYWDESELEYVHLHWKRAYVRQMMGRVKGPDAQRRFINITRTDKKGRRIKVYRDREKMTVKEFEQAVEQYRRLGAKGFAMAKSLAEDCWRIHHVQLELAFAGKED